MSDETSQLLVNSSCEIQPASRDISSVSDSRINSCNDLPHDTNCVQISTSGIVKDRLYVTYMIFFLIGIASLLPWNFFITAKQYFSYKFRNVSCTNVSTYNNRDLQTDLQNMFESYVSASAMTANVLFMCFNALVTRWISTHLRIVTSFLVMIVAFGATLLLTVCSTDSWQMGFFYITIVCVVIINAASAVLQGAMLGIASTYPTLYCQAIMGGMAMGGTIAAAANIIVISAAPSSNPTSIGLGYFAIAQFFIIIAFIAYLALPSCKFARYQQGRQKMLLSVSCEGMSVNYTDNLEDNQPLFTPPPSSLLHVFKQLRLYAFCVFFTFCITLACFPGLISYIKSTSLSQIWSGIYYIAVVCFLFFNFFDFVGRLAGGYVSGVNVRLWLPVLVILRALLLPAFMFSNIQPRKHLPVNSFFSEDATVAILVVLLGTTNGFFGTTAMIYGPRHVAPKDQEVAGAMMSFFLSVGLATGALTSIILRKEI